MEQSTNGNIMEWDIMGQRDAGASVGTWLRLNPALSYDSFPKHLVSIRL